VGLGQVLREFGVKVSLSFDGKAVDQAESRIKKFSSEMKSFALEVAGVSAGLFATGKSFSHFSREVVDQADGLGITTDALQEYEYAAGVAADATREDVVGAFKNLGDTLDKARAGVPEASQALYNMAAAGGKTKEMLAAIQNPMTKVSDVALLLSSGIQKMSEKNPLAARRMTELAYGSDKLYNLWRKGPDAIKALNSEADKNSVLNEKMLREGKLMDQQITKLWFVFRKFGLEIGAKIMPHVMKLVGQFEKWFKANQKLIASGITGFLDTLANVLEGVFDAGVGIIKFLEPMIAALGGASQVVKDLVYAFVAFKTISIASSFLSMGFAIAKFAATLLGIGPTFSTIASSIGGLAGTIGSFLGGLTAVVAAGWAGYELATKLNDYIDSKTGGQGIGGKLYDLIHPDEQKEILNQAGPKSKVASAPRVAPFSQVGPTAAYAGGGTSQGPVVNQTHNVVNNLTVSTPEKATVSDTATAAKKAQTDANEMAMRKAKADAARTRVY
jgi:hypothetical protein